MKIELGSVKGFNDYLPQEAQKRAKVREIIEKHFRKYGFLPIETPIIEFDEAMRSDVLDGDDEASADRFRLKDRGGRNLGLRHEFTFQLARLFRQNPNIKTPARFYQIGPVFRDEPISQDRFRQFTQCDADIIGDSSTLADVECLAMLNDILKELKINAQIQVSNRKLLTAIIESVEISHVKDVMKELDKKDKIGEDLMKLNLKKYADSNQILTLMKLLEKDFNFFKENAFDGVDELESLFIRAKKYSVSLKFNPFLIRNFGYYTGNIFEAVVPGKSPLAGGGRYSKLVGKHVGKEISSAGISLGLDRISQIAQVSLDTAKAMLVSLEKEQETLRLTRKLREAGISCLPSFENINKSLELANEQKIPFVIFIGEEEIRKARYKVRDMISEAEKLLAEKQVIDELLGT